MMASRIGRSLEPWSSTTTCSGLDSPKTLELMETGPASPKSEGKEGAEYGPSVFEEARGRTAMISSG
jgi:hypothetical protein